MNASRYPTTAALAHMRAGLMSAPSLARLSTLHVRPDWEVYRTWVDAHGWRTHPATGGAWSDERTDGIGWQRVTSPASLIGWGYVNDDGRPRLVNVLDARREASALRSRTFARIAHEAMGDAGLSLDLDAAMQTFEPMPATTQED